VYSNVVGRAVVSPSWAEERQYRLDSWQQED